MKTVTRSFESIPGWTNVLPCGWGNGYVLIPKGHKYHGKHYDDIPVDAHGGLTFSRLIDKEHVKNWDGLNNNDIGCWMIGFDTAHFDDDPINCDYDFVKMETENIKKQLIK